MKPVSTQCVSCAVSTRTVFVWPPGVGAGLEHRDLVSAREQVGGDQAGDAGADDGDPHETVIVDARGMEDNPWPTPF